MDRGVIFHLKSGRGEPANSASRTLIHGSKQFYMTRLPRPIGQETCCTLGSRSLVKGLILL